METMTNLRTTSKQRLIATFGIIAFLLAIPLVAMQFTNEVDWKLGDFIIMGALLTATGLAIELVTRKVKTANGRILLTIAILIVLFLIWAELAVGVFGTPFAGS
jgi:Kef-type K+ transport system membrane component KefB